MKEKSKQRKTKRNKPIVKPSVEQEGMDTSSEMDFGGIPKRDLKKNLGCA